MTRSNTSPQTMNLSAASLSSTGRPTSSHFRVMVCVVLGLACAGGAVAQERRVLPRSGEAYFPLRAGALWKFRRTRAGGVASSVELLCRGRVASGKNEGFELWVTADGDEPGGYEYWRADATGLFEFNVANKVGSPASPTPGLLTYVPVRWLPTPVGVETEWTWSSPVRPREGSGRWPTAEFRGAVEHFADELVVPAGKFEGVKVSVVFRWPESEEGLRTVMWFVPGVGPVRREVYDLGAAGETLRERDELVEFAPGPTEVADPSQAAARFVAANRALWPGEEPTLRVLEIPPLDSAVASSFVLATAGDDRRVLAVMGDEVTPIDFARIDSLRALWKGETRPSTGKSNTGALATFAKLCLLLQQAARGVAVAAPVRFRTTRMTGVGNAAGFTHTGSFATATDEVEVVVKDGDLRSVTIKAK
ncbi:MAG: hypothetical protein R3F56_00795 [Planctomycetota bacterium]